MKKLSPWFLAIRPKTLPAALGPVLIGIALSAPEAAVDWTVAGLCLSGALLIQIGTNLANDYFDFRKGTDTVERKGPTRVTQAGLIKPETVRAGFILVFALSAVIGWLLALRGGWPIVAIAVASIASGILYTGGPRPLGYIGLGDVFAFVFFGPVAVAGTYYLQTMQVTAPVILAGAAPGFLSVAILTVNNLRDVDGDRTSGKKTLAVRFGHMFARWEYFGSLMAAALIPVILALWTRGHVWGILSSFVVILLGRTLVRRVTMSSDGATLNDVLAQTGQLLFIYSVVFSMGWII